jgi:hypothetical protein
MRFASAKPDHIYRCRTDPQRMFFMSGPKYSHELDGKAGPNSRFNHARSGPPGGLAGLPMCAFPRNSDILQQPVVQQTQILLSLPAS